MILVSDTGPLIALAKLDRLALLPQLFDAVLTPPAVQRELLAKSGPEAPRLDEAFERWIQATPLPELAPEVQIVTQRLDNGERQAIALAYVQAALLLMDERLGRAAARQLGVRVTGLVGVLIEAKRAGHLQAIQPLLETLRQRGYWLADELIHQALLLAGEL